MTPQPLQVCEYILNHIETRYLWSQYTKTSKPCYNIQSFLQPNEQRMQKHHPTWSSRNKKNHVIGFGYHHCHGTYCSASSKGIQPSQFWKLWDACLPDTRVGGPPRKHFSTIMKFSKKEFLWFKWITAASRYDTDGRVTVFKGNWACNLHLGLGFRTSTGPPITVASEYATVAWPFKTLWFVWVMAHLQVSDYWPYP